MSCVRDLRKILYTRSWLLFRISVASVCICVVIFQLNNSVRVHDIRERRFLRSNALLSDRTGFCVSCGDQSIQGLPDELSGVTHARAETLRSACARLAQSGYELPLCNFRNEPKILFFAPRENFLFCTVSKAASTFWTDTLNATSRIERLNATKNKVLGQFYSYKKVIFVRDPYSRLLAAYIDKFVVPNHMYWEIGKRIVRKYHKNTSYTAGECGQDVTFADFIQEVINTAQQDRLDIHWRPIHRHCCPCTTQYNLVGKLETMTADKNYILRNLHLGPKPSVNPQTEDTTARMINTTIYNMYARLKHTWVGRCISVRDGLRRLFHKMQIQGVFRTDISHENIFHNVTAVQVDEAQSVFMAAYHKYGIHPSNRAIPRRKALLDFYSSIPKEHMVALRRLYHLDFLLFGYDDTPPDLFRQEKT